MQALYQWMMSGADLYEIEAQFRAEHDSSKVDIEYFKELLYQIPKQLADIDTIFTPFLDRSIDELNPVELSILRIGCYELRHRLEIPYRVVINESVSLTKEFGAEEGHKYVNGVLDKVAKCTRQSEMGA